MEKNIQRDNKSSYQQKPNAPRPQVYAEGQQNARTAPGAGDRATEQRDAGGRRDDQQRQPGSVNPDTERQSGSKETAGDDDEEEEDTGTEHPERQPTPWAGSILKRADQFDEKVQGFIKSQPLVILAGAVALGYFTNRLLMKDFKGRV